MQIRSTQEALFIACEMERGAVQLYERALILLKNQNRDKEPLRAQLSYMLADEKQHLLQFTELYAGLDSEVERTLTLSAVASDIPLRSNASYKTGNCLSDESSAGVSVPSKSVPTARTVSPPRSRK